MEWIVLWRRWAPPHNPPKKPTNAAQRATLINFFGLVYWAAPSHALAVLSSIGAPLRIRPQGRESSQAKTNEKNIKTVMRLKKIKTS